MDLKYGLISSDSHAQEHPHTWTSRMSKVKWGDRIPHIAEISEPDAGGQNSDRKIERWFIDGRPMEKRGTVNCPTAMGDPLRKTYPQRWDEVPEFVFDPRLRLEAQERDGIDAEILFLEV